MNEVLRDLVMPESELSIVFISRITTFILHYARNTKPKGVFVGYSIAQFAQKSIDNLSKLLAELHT